MASNVSLLTVSYPVRPESEAAFVTCLGDINRRVIDATGFLGLGIDSRRERPSEIEWKATYKFASDQDRSAWLASANCSDLQARVASLLTSSSKEFLGEQEGSERSLQVIRSRVAPDDAAKWNQENAHLNAAVAKFPGFRGLDLFKPDDESDVWTTMISFASALDARRWMESEEGKRTMGSVESLGASEILETSAPRGQWFSTHATPTARTPAWKD